MKLSIDKVTTYQGMVTKPVVAQTRYDAGQDVPIYITTFYNSGRLHLYLRYLSPLITNQRWLN